MLEIAPTTLDRLAAPHEEAFLTRVVARLATDFPQHSQTLGPERMRGETRALIARGRHHGLRSEADLYRFTALGVTFGATFDDDDGLPWARATLNSRILGTPSERLEQLVQLGLAAIRQDGRPTLALAAAD